MVQYYSLTNLQAKILDFKYKGKSIKFIKS